MLGGHKDPIELECPECGASFEATREQAESGMVSCPLGHEFAIMGTLDAPSADGDGPR